MHLPSRLICAKLAAETLGAYAWARACQIRQSARCRARVDRQSMRCSPGGIDAFAPYFIAHSPKTQKIRALAMYLRLSPPIDSGEFFGGPSMIAAAVLVVECGSTRSKSLAK